MSLALVPFVPARYARLYSGNQSTLFNAASRTKCLLTKPWATHHKAQNNLLLAYARYTGPPRLVTTAQKTGPKSDLCILLTPLKSGQATAIESLPVVRPEWKMDRIGAWCQVSRGRVASVLASFHNTNSFQTVASSTSE